jgi:Cu+-exporting ATPase
LFISFISFVGWYFYSSNFEHSFMIAISVIVIACPCALALATPVATLVGLSLGTKRGILFKEAAQLETMAQTDVLLLDKTGTLTVGKPEVVSEKTFEEFDKNLLYSLVKSSNHPVACGIKEFLLSQDENLQDMVFDEFSQVPACGIEAKYENIEIFGGNLKLMKSNGIEISYESENTLFYFAINKKVMAIYELSDKIKDEAKELVDDLSKRGIEVVMLTGDHGSIAKKVADEIGIEKFLYEQTPEDKSQYVEMLHKEDKKVVMVGDGVNDILALANADIGIVMGSGSDIAIDVGDVVLLNNSLKSLQDAFKISRTTLFLIKQNLLLSLIYNGITVPLAIAGYVIPLVAAISMSISSLLVVGNSMRIRMKWDKG